MVLSNDYYARNMQSLLEKGFSVSEARKLNDMHRNFIYRIGKSAAKGDAEAQFMLGMIYRFGFPNAYPPGTCSHADMAETVRKMLVDTCGTSVKVNADKTENSVAKKVDDKLHIYACDGITPSRIQYLGFHLSSHGVHIRNSSISKDRGKTVQAVASAHRRKNYGKIDTKSVYKTKSHRQVTDWNPLNEKGFINYADRSAEAFGNSETISKQLRKSDRFVRRAVKRRREKIAREQDGNG